MASSAIYAQLATATLLDVLTQERTNLATITTQSSRYASSEQPLHQYNQAHDILQRIQQITIELTARGVAIPPPHSVPTSTATTLPPSIAPAPSGSVQRVTATAGSEIRGVQQTQTAPTEQVVEARDQSTIADVTQHHGSQPKQGDAS